MAQPAGSYTHIGSWVNWSNGLVLGSTITLSERDGGLLTSFLGIFVTIAGAACWKITSYVLHQSRCRQSFEDGLHHQQQVILRNDSTAGGVAWQMTRLIWYWRKDALKPFLRTFPFVLLAVANMALFGVAGIFSSEVIKAAGNETLVRSPNCGVLNIIGSGAGAGGAGAAGASLGVLAASTSLDTNQTNQATTYARACYGNTQSAFGCNQYVKQQIPWTVNQNASCPFGDDLCFYGASSAYEMDSGLIDSNDVLGINARKSDRVQVRKVTTCSPIKTRGYSTEINVTDSSQADFGETEKQYLFGQAGDHNYTYTYIERSLTDGYGYVLTYVLPSSSSTEFRWFH